VCPHYHHLYDGITVLAALQRTVRIFVALDWARNRAERGCMEALCRWADWPVVLRDPARGNPWGGAYRASERLAYVRSSLSHSLRLLERGELLAIFPEGYPVVDPVGHQPRPVWPPFEGGYLGIAMRANALGMDVPLVPAGFSYAGEPQCPTAVTVRFGPADRISNAGDRAAAGIRIQSQVRALSS
jgi:1-acyl-sn-glycerol-3-phosphate acyltransferase